MKLDIPDLPEDFKPYAYPVRWYELLYSVVSYALFVLAVWVTNGSRKKAVRYAYINLLEFIPIIRAIEEAEREEEDNEGHAQFPVRAYHCTLTAILAASLTIILVSAFK